MGPDLLNDLTTENRDVLGLVRSGKVKLHLKYEAVMELVRVKVLFFTSGQEVKLMIIRSIYHIV